MRAGRLHRRAPHDGRPGRRELELPGRPGQQKLGEATRERAQRALRELGAGSLPLLVAVMQDQTKSEEARLACLEVCPACGDAAVEYLLQALNDEVLKQSAYWSLRDLGNGVIPRLLSVAEDQDRYSEHVRLAAANLLVEFTDGFGAGPEDYAWTGGHALMERESFAIQSEPDMSDGAGGASAMLMSEAPESPGGRIARESSTPGRAESGVLCD